MRTILSGTLGIVLFLNVCLTGVSAAEFGSGTAVMEGSGATVSEVGIPVAESGSLTGTGVVTTSSGMVSMPNRPLPHEFRNQSKSPPHHTGTGTVNVPLALQPSLTPDTSSMESQNFEDSTMMMTSMSTSTWSSTSLRPIAEYLLNGNTNDTSGNGNNGTAYNVTWTPVDGHPEIQGGSFNGANSIVTVPHSYAQNVANISVTFKYKPAALADNSGIVAKWGYQPDSNGANQWAVYQNADGKIRFALNTGDIAGIASTTIVNNVNHTYSIVAMYDGATMKLYIDNVLEASVAKT